jgi:hypothetical protein
MNLAKTILRGAILMPIGIVGALAISVLVLGSVAALIVFTVGTER